MDPQQTRALDDAVTSLRGQLSAIGLRIHGPPLLRGSLMGPIPVLAPLLHIVGGSVAEDQPDMSSLWHVVLVGSYLRGNSVKRIGEVGPPRSQHPGALAQVKGALATPPGCAALDPRSALPARDLG